MDPPVEAQSSCSQGSQTLAPCLASGLVSLIAQDVAQMEVSNGVVLFTGCCARERVPSVLPFTGGVLSFLFCFSFFLFSFFFVTNSCNLNPFWSPPLFLGDPCFWG